MPEQFPDTYFHQKTQSIFPNILKPELLSGNHRIDRRLVLPRRRFAWTSPSCCRSTCTARVQRPETPIAAISSLPPSQPNRQRPHRHHHRRRTTSPPPQPSPPLPRPPATTLTPLHATARSGASVPRTKTTRPPSSHRPVRPQPLPSRQPPVSHRNPHLVRRRRSASSSSM